MPLSWNEIRARTARFTEEWKDAHYEKGQTQTFYNEFFDIFGHSLKEARFRLPGSTLADLYDPITLLNAHQTLDNAVDIAYRKQIFFSNRKRVEFLFAQYQHLRPWARRN